MGGQCDRGVFRLVHCAGRPRPRPRSHAVRWNGGVRAWRALQARRAQACRSASSIRKSVRGARHRPSTSIRTPARSTRFVPPPNRRRCLSQCVGTATRKPATFGALSPGGAGRRGRRGRRAGEARRVAAGRRDRSPPPPIARMARGMCVACLVTRVGAPAGRASRSWPPLHRRARKACPRFCLGHGCACGQQPFAAHCAGTVSTLPCRRASLFHGKPGPAGYRRGGAPRRVLCVLSVGMQASSACSLCPVSSHMASTRVTHALHNCAPPPSPHASLHRTASPIHPRVRSRSLASSFFLR
jgi:hypothetical protein